LDSLRKLKVAELKAELEARGRSTAGLKADLVERLARVVASGEDAAADRSPAAEPAGDSPAVQRTMFNSRPASSSSASDAIVVDGDTNFSGMEVVFLGTSSGSPSFTRNVSSYALRLTDEIWLFDCGEATQHQLMRSKLRYTKITRIFITHMHGDHIFGLPGLICALSGARAELRRVHGKDPTPLYITGPPGICDYVRAAITCSRTVLGLPLIVTELVAPGNGARGQARFFLSHRFPYDRVRVVNFIP
jgi:ribonuclease Z